MLITNKKFVIGLVLLTVVGGSLFLKSHKMMQQLPQNSVLEFSNSFNKSLPLRITNDISLIKTQMGSVTEKLYSLDFFYAYYKNKKEIENFDQLAQSMIYQTCQNETILPLLQNNVIIKHQFITLDKEILPYIGVSIQDCLKIKK